MKRKLAYTASSLVLAGLLTEAGTALAAASIEEIVVSARKREESIQSVPLSVTAFGASMLQNRGTSIFDELIGFVPNMSQTGGGQSEGNVFTIRGLSTSSNNPGFETGIGFYVDEVYIGKSYAFNTALLDVDSVEIMRGPQGTLFGRNTIAGAIAVKTATPGNDFQANLSVDYGNYDTLEVSGYAGGALVEDKAFFRIAAMRRDRDGYLKDDVTGDDYNNEDSWFVRGKLLFNLSDATELTLTADYYTDDNVDSIMDVRGGALAPVDPTPLKDRSIGTDFQSYGERTNYGFMGRLAFDLGQHELISITSYRAHDADGLIDQDFTVMDLSYTGRLQEQKQFSQELRLVSQLDGPFNYIAGLYYFDQNLDSVTTANLGTIAIGNVETAYTIGDVNSTAYAAYGSFTYDISDQISLAGGLRYTEENKDLDFSQTLSPGAIVMELAGIAIPIAPTTDDLDEGEWSGDISLKFQATDDVMFYGSFARGYKAGGFNATLLGTTPTALSFKAETIDSFEIGMKSDWLDNRLRLNVSAFYADYKNKQEQVLSGTAFIVGNAASAESKGFEVELMAKPVEDFQILATLGYLDAEYKSFPGCTLDAVGAPVDCSGNEMSNAPELTASLVGEYVVPITDDLGLTLRGEVTHHGSSYVNLTNDPAFVQEKLTLVNARVTLASNDDGWAVALWGRNLFKTEKEEFGFDFLGTQYTYLNAPRTYGIRLSYTH